MKQSALSAYGLVSMASPSDPKPSSLGGVVTAGSRRLGDKDGMRLNRAKNNLYRLRASLGILNGRKKKALIDACIEDVNAVLDGEDYKHLLPKENDE